MWRTDLPLFVASAVALLGAAAASAGARASFGSQAGAAEAIATAQLDAPTSLTVSCVIGSFDVSLAWSAASSGATGGYAILRSATAGGPYTRIGTTSEQSGTTYTDTIAPLAEQYYLVEAVRNGWTSPDSNEAGVQSLALGVCAPA